MSRLALVLLVFAAIVLGRTDRAHAQAPSCQELALDAAVESGRKLTTLLKVANFRADVKYMGQVAGDLEAFLGKCKDEDLALICDYDCHLQLGRYNLFFAADLPFLSASGGISRNDTPLSPQALQEVAERGVKLVDRGLGFLARQQAGSGQAGAKAEASYRTFVRQLVPLNGVKIRLLMSIGDNWYQTVSEARIKQLDFFLAESLGAGANAGVDSQPNLSKAYTNYEAAMWVVVETKMDIPDESTFDDLRADLMVLEKELRDRMDSIRQGFLFIGIDPLQFTSIKFEELEKKIKESRDSLEAVENEIGKIVKEWHADKLGEATRTLDEQRTVRSQQINLAAHRIGKLEQEAATFAADVEKEINGVKLESDTLESRQQVRRLEMELATKLAEFENQRDRLNRRNDLDLIALSKDAEVDRRSELRWLMSWQMAQMNIDMQISSIRTQIAEHQRQRDTNSNGREQIKLKIDQKNKTIALAQNSIARIELRKEELAKRKTDTYRQKRAVAREGICRIEKELAFVGSTPDQSFVGIDEAEKPCTIPAAGDTFTRTDFVLRMCGDANNPGLRKKLNNERIRARAFVLQCIVGDTDMNELKSIIANGRILANGAADLVGVDCGSFTQTEKDLATKIWKMELQGIEATATELAKRRDALTNQIDSVGKWAKDFLSKAQTLADGVQIAEATFATLSAIPEISVHIAGLASGSSTKIDPAKAAKAAVEALRNALDTALKVGKIEEETERTIKGLTGDLASIQQEMKQIDFAKAMKAVALDRTHFELAGRRAEGMNEIKQLVLEDSISDVDCEAQNLNIEERVSTLRSEHARELAALELTSKENDLLDFEVRNQDFLIAQAQGEIEIAQQDIELLALEDKRLENDNSTIDHLMVEAQERIGRVRAVETSVKTLADDSVQSTNVINELIGKQRLAMLALNEKEIGFLEQRITQDKSNTTELIDGLNKARDLIIKNGELKKSITDFAEKIRPEIDKQRDDLTALVSQVDDPNTHKNLFIADQEALADLLKGIPEYVVSKRRLLETANLNLHLMRRRYALTTGIVGAQDDWLSTYVRNTSQLTAMVDGVSNNRFFDERPINIEVAQIAIPANSGFARSLAQTGKVSFEVSPYATTEEAMRRLGYLSLWNAAKFTDVHDMRLIDVLVAIRYPCAGEQRNQFVLSHDGSGMVFRALTEGSSETVAQLEIGPARADRQAFFNLATAQDRIDAILDFWEDRFQVRSFPPAAGPPNDTDAKLPYLGAPVIGNYSLSLLPSTCGYDGAEYTLYLIYSSTT